MLQLLIVFAVGLSSLNGAFAPKSSDGVADTYKQNCSRCHGDLGRGDGPAVKILKAKPHDLSNTDYMSKLSDEDLYKVIEKGGVALGKSKQMPAYEGKLKKKEIEELVRFVRAFAER